MDAEAGKGIVGIATADGEMKAYQALPQGARDAPALIVAQEAFGVNGHIRSVCDRFAAEGFIALAPDLYHRSGELLTYGYDDPKRREPFSELTNAGITSDLAATLEWLKQRPEVDASRIGIVGFCVGGFVAFLAACRFEQIATAVCFYGGGIVNAREGLRLEPLMTEVDRIEVPVLCFFGGRDTSIPMAEVEAVRNALARQPREHEVVVYPEAGHGFFCDERPSYDAAAAEDAWKRTRAWLELRLKALASYPTED